MRGQNGQRSRSGSSRAGSNGPNGSAASLPLPDPASAPSAPSAAAPASVPLLDTFDGYAAAQGIKPGTATEWRARMQDLIAFLGHDDAARITEDDVQRWRDHLLSETVRSGRKRDPRTVRSTYISALRATLAWPWRNVKLPRNVAAAITVRVPKKAKFRERDFTPQEAKRILAATLTPDPTISAERAFARRWIPWLCAYKQSLGATARGGHGLGANPAARAAGYDRKGCQILCYG